MNDLKWHALIGCYCEPRDDAPQLCHLFRPKNGPDSTPSFCGAITRKDQPVHPFKTCELEHQVCAVCLSMCPEPV